MGLKEFDPPLDPSFERLLNTYLRRILKHLNRVRAEKGHACSEPTVRFHGNRSEMCKAVGVALSMGFWVKELKRVWPGIDGELTGPYWEMTPTSLAG